jgi:hypothetical protein
MALSDVEKRFLSELRAMRREKAHCTYRTLASRLGYRSLARIYQLFDALAEKGYDVSLRQVPFITKRAA